MTNGICLFLTLFDRTVKFGMLMTIRARFSADKIPPLPLVDSVFDETMVGLVNAVDIVLIFPFCPFTREMFGLSERVISRSSRGNLDKENLHRSYSYR